MIKTLHVSTNLSQLLHTFGETVQFKTLFIHMIGTNDTGQTVTKANCGRLQIKKRGVTIVDAELDFLHEYALQTAGYAHFESNEAGVFEWLIPIPRRFFDDNVETVLPSDNYTVQISFPAAFNTALASCTTSILIDQERGPEKYTMNFHQLTQTVASGTTPMTFNQDNIFAVGFGDHVSSVLTFSSSNITSARFEWNGQVSDGTLDQFVKVSNWNLDVESEDILACFPIIAQGDITSRIADAFSASITASGAAYPQFLVVSGTFDDTRLKNSRNAQYARYNRLIAAKRAKNKFVQAAAIDRVAGVATPTSAKPSAS